ncbi:MAG: xanthine dehydrogenase [Planctomycetota bacterium]|nr:MAG: xanthine dehydrogenase [Planctomycetota bacterium]
MSAPDIWQEIVACRRRGEPAALATIVSAMGSTPGKDPMKMLVRADGSIVGSVGGGCLEAEVWDTAKQVMQSGRSSSVSFTLTEEHYPDSGLVCGGTVTIFVEPVTPPTLHIFGAGHVGLATAHLAADVGFRVVVRDDRPDMLDPERFPDPLLRAPGPWDEGLASMAPGPFDYVLVATRGHHDDEQVLRLLAAADLRPRLLGLLGSAAKRKVLLGRLAADGVPQAWLEQVLTPVGLHIGARTAAEIAVSIVGQLVQRVRIGAPEPSGAAPKRRRSAQAP